MELASRKQSGLYLLLRISVIIWWRSAPCLRASGRDVVEKIHARFKLRPSPSYSGYARGRPHYRHRTSTSHRQLHSQNLDMGRNWRTGSEFSRGTVNKSSSDILGKPDSPKSPPAIGVIREQALPSRTDVPTLTSSDSTLRLEYIGPFLN